MRSFGVIGGSVATKRQNTEAFLRRAMNEATAVREST